MPTAGQRANFLLSAHRRCSRLATLALLAALFAEREYCQTHEPSLHRSCEVRERHQQFYDKVKAVAEYFATTRAASCGGLQLEAAGAGITALGACILLLETSPLDNLASQSGALAGAVEALGGLDWGIHLLRSDGFRCDEAADQVSSIGRQLLFDLVSLAVCQRRPLASAGDDASMVARTVACEADTGWPATAPQLQGLQLRSEPRLPPISTASLTLVLMFVDRSHGGDFARSSGVGRALLE
jgi:hypothetical protein